MDWTDTAAHIKCEIFLDEIHIVLFLLQHFKANFCVIKKIKYIYILEGQKNKELTTTSPSFSLSLIPQGDSR